MTFKPSAPTGEARERGRPPSYRPEFAEQARKLCAYHDARDIDLAQFFECDIRTLYRWKLEHEAFCHAIKLGKEATDDRVENAMLRNALGYTHDSVKILSSDGEVFEVPYIEHSAPNVTAGIFWLTNRRPDKWKRAQPVAAGAPDADDFAKQVSADRIYFDARPDEPIPDAPVL
jgi:hypothetical protein